MIAPNDLETLYDFSIKDMIKAETYEWGSDRMRELVETIEDMKEEKRPYYYRLLAENASDS